ncbi:hypothetical protein KY290_016645 [Solanum tuberosum]|uniref:Uncharacterized protein n=1 Tax=Solanum tuberosum TaxID=4113 RepID=A0ABQ7V928_SOLTU|nr:hypothetical protein KY284_015923 [Solanum tuberosum]KAH0760572.1 hypothetical protein KY290_016645 [Solanum tuberosum]
MAKLLLRKRCFNYGRLEGYWVNRCQIDFVQNVLRITKNDVGAKHQIRLHQLQEKFDRNELEHQRRHSEEAKVIAQLKQELQKSRQCLSELDNSMEQQIQSVERFRHQEGARLARDHLWANRYAMWEEVSIAKRSRLGERSG